jgi:Arc/MetJ family transcription regulator
MPANVVIDPHLLEKAFELSGERTKDAAVTKALREFIARRQQRHILDLMNKLEWDGSYDYKEERSRR